MDPSITDARISLRLEELRKNKVVYDYEAYLEGSDKEKKEFILEIHNFTGVYRTS